jgi:hypothetical protein
MSEKSNLSLSNRRFLFLEYGVLATAKTVRKPSMLSQRDIETDEKAEIVSLIGTTAQDFCLLDRSVLSCGKQ